MQFEEVWFYARDGVKLHGWFIQPPASFNRNITVLLGHGHSGNKEPDLDYAKFLHDAGYNVFMFDFRGHGRSEEAGGASMGHHERLDVHGAVDWLVGRGQTRLAAMGFSMGASILIMAAAENPLIRAVVADSAYAHLYRSISAEINNMWRIPMWLGRPLGHYAWRIHANYHRFAHRNGSPANYVKQIAPRRLLLIHGEKDRLTRLENAHILYELAADPKELWVLPELGHSVGLATLGQVYIQRVLDFLASVDWDMPLELSAPSQTLDGLLTTNPV
jgi:dipeptidyl aminopeptidase/acylaminoacyl peptidase